MKLARIPSALIPLTLVLFALALLTSPCPTLAQAKPAFAPNQMDTVLYGVAYYTEYMPYERLDKDVELIQRAEIYKEQRRWSGSEFWKRRRGF